MDNKNNYLKLDETVKKALSKYEAPGNSNDWAQLESMLEVSPKQHTLNRSLSPIQLGGIAFFVIVLFLYLVIPSSDDSDKKEDFSNQQEEPDNSELTALPLTAQLPDKDKLTNYSENNDFLNFIKALSSTANRTDSIIPPFIYGSKTVIDENNMHSPKPSIASSSTKRSEKKALVNKDKDPERPLVDSVDKKAKKPKSKNLKKEDSLIIDPALSAELKDTAKNKKLVKITNELLLDGKTDTVKGLNQKSNEKIEPQKETKKSKRDKKSRTHDFFGWEKSPFDTVNDSIK